MCPPAGVWGAVAAPSGGGVERLLLEKPQKYPRDAVDPNNLITLALSAGIAIGPFLVTGTVLETVLPKQWKQQLPKDVCHSRCWAGLSPREQEVVSVCGKGVAKKPLLDMLDAVALGRWYVGRAG